MIKTITQNDIVRYIYNETTSSEGQMIEKDIVCNDETADAFYQLNESKRTLEEGLYTPSQKSIDNILSFSKMYSKIEATL